MITARSDNDLQGLERPQPSLRRRIGVVVAVSMAAGVLAAVGLVAAPFVPANAHILSGVALLGFGSGWALLAVLSVRLTDQPQRWAAAPAALLAATGVASCSGSAAVQAVLGWVGPPVLLAVAVWMFLRARPQLRDRSARRLLAGVIACLAVVAIGGGYATVREAYDAEAHPAPGQLVDVGGHRLHLHCTGSGSPTVVLEPGLGASSADLHRIAPAVAATSRVCVYDRAGRGWSDAADGPQDAAHIAQDLQTLLVRAHVPGPYVLAGHSFGGLYVQAFAARFPDQVAGLVLLDSTAPKPGPPVTPATVPARLVLASTAVLPTVGSFVEEFAAGGASMRQAAELTDLAGKPLIVLTADTGHDPTWPAKQDQLATLSTSSVHRIAHATHQSLLDSEVDSAAAVQAIHDVVASVRSSSPLPGR